MKPFLKIALAAFILGGFSRAQATGLSTPFADVQIDSVPVGTPFIVTHSAADGLLLQNLEGEALKVRVQTFAPAAADLRGGALAIPDVEWIRIVPDHAVIPPHGRILCRITLLVPKQKIYRGKYYQVMIWSRGELPQSQGMGMSAGLLSRLRFKTN